MLLTHSESPSEVPKGFPDNSNFRTANEISWTVLDIDEHAAQLSCSCVQVYSHHAERFISVSVCKEWSRAGKVPPEQPTKVFCSFIPLSLCKTSTVSHSPLKHLHVCEESAGWSHFYREYCDVDCCFIFSTLNILSSSSLGALWSLQQGNG